MAVTVGYVAASGPLLEAPLAGGDAVDATTTKHLLKCALRKKQKEEEEERRRKEKKEDEELRKRAQRIVDDAASLPLPGRGSRKKLPPFTLPRQGCRRPCDHQRRVPAVQRVRSGRASHDTTVRVLLQLALKKKREEEEEERRRQQELAELERRMHVLDRRLGTSSPVRSRKGHRYRATN